MDLTEKEIIKQLKEGDKKAYQYLFDEHYKVLCQIAVGFLKSNFLAESIVGDIIYNLWEKRNTINIQTSLRAYLIRSVRNRCINYLQQAHIIKEKTLSQLPTDEISNSSTYISDQIPINALLEKELEQEIMESINKLPAECKTVFQLSRFENLKYQEIAKQLDISVNTVKYHIKSALNRLGKDLKDYIETA